MKMKKNNEKEEVVMDKKKKRKKKLQENEEKEEEGEEKAKGEEGGGEQQQQQQQTEKQPSPRHQQQNCGHFICHVQSDWYTEVMNKADDNFRIWPIINMIQMIILDLISTITIRWLSFLVTVIIWLKIS